MIFGYAKMAITLVMIIGIGGALTYVFKLRADNAVLKANNLVLEKSVESQQQVIAQQKEDFKTILETNNFGKFGQSFPKPKCVLIFICF